ncbi:serine acetyltransferase [Coprothermobacteraceae bacterium]|nr:serine acetyltransferase [Coprothermobacteraceae bacterium]
MWLLFKELQNLPHVVRQDIEALLEKDPSLRTAGEVWLHAGFLSLLWYRISHAFYLSNFRFLARLFHLLNRIVFSVDIHPGAYLEPGVAIDHGVGIVIGETAIVGAGTLIYHGVTLGARRLTRGVRHPRVGRNVVLGAGAVLLGAIEVGDRARVGANAVVLEHVPAGATVVGNPARVLNVAAKGGDAA